MRWLVTIIIVVGHKSYIPCYAVRKELGLCNSSAIGEKMNDLVVSERQKHNGMSWSKSGSVSLATITALKRNKENDKWFKEKEFDFKLAAQFYLHRSIFLEIFNSHHTTWFMLRRLFDKCNQSLSHFCSISKSGNQDKSNFNILKIYELRHFWMNLWALLNLFEFFSLNSPYCVPGSTRFRWVEVPLDLMPLVDIQQVGGNA